MKDIAFFLNVSKLTFGNLLKSSITFISLMVLIIRNVWHVISNNDSKRELPRSLFEITTKGLLNIIENTHPWNESVITNDASIKALNHFSTGG